MAARWYWLLPLALLFAIWWPEIERARLPQAAVSAAVQAALVQAPDDATLARIGQVDLSELGMLPTAPAGAATKLANGVLDMPGAATGPVQVRGFPHDYLQGPSNLLLYMASLSPENQLLRAYAQGGDPTNLDVALQRTLQLARQERTRWHDRSFLWNDHAVASRVSVLVELWRHLRTSPRLKPDDANALVSFAQRSGVLLAKPSHFTARTNHGVMQNIALLQLAAAFPALPESARWRQLAVERLRLQLAFYVSPEGVVLEHSPGYHEMGARLMTSAQDLIALNGLPPEPALDKAVAGTRNVLRGLVRPDGELPLIGNTHTGKVAAAATPVPEPAGDAFWYPVSGWAIWRTPGGGTPGSHLMLAWANHTGHGHKRPDEGSLHWWSDGVDWITASGYWPYGTPMTRAAYSWLASNAPHTPGEPGRSARQSRLLAHAEAGVVRAADMQRQGQPGPTFRRQVVQLAGNTVLALDFSAGSPGGSETLWTLGDGLLIAPQATPERFETRPLPDGRRLILALASNQGGMQTRVLRASESPFAGWVVRDAQPQPASSVLVLQPAQASAVATLLHVSRLAGVGTSASVALAPDATTEQWKAMLLLDGQPWTVQRAGMRIQVTGPALQARTLSLAVPATETDPAIAAVAAGFRQAVEAFPPWRDLWRYRVELSQWVLLAAVAAELGLLLVGAVAARRWPALQRRLGWALGAAWMAVSYWILAVHFGQ